MAEEIVPTKSKEPQQSGAPGFLSLPVFHPWFTLLGCLVVTLLIATGTQNLTVSSDTRRFAGPENADLKRLEAFEDVYSQNNNVFIALHAPDGSVFTEQRIRALHQMTDGAWALPFAIRVDSITNYQFLDSVGDDVEIKALSPFAYDPSRADLTTTQRMRLFQERVAREDLLKNWLISEDGATAAININFQIPTDATLEVAEIMAAVRKFVADETGSSNGADLVPHITGNIALMALFAEAAERDTASIVPGCFLLIGFMVVLFFRFSMSTFFILTSVLMATLIALGFAGYNGRVIDPGFSAVPVIVMILALASGVHFVIGTHKYVDDGLSGREAVLASIKANFFPIFLTTATTSVGFFVLNFADSPSFHALANVVTVGVVSGFILCFTWIAAGLALFPIKPSKQPASAQNFLGGFTDFLNRHTFGVMFASVILSLVLLMGVSRTYLDADFIRYFDESFTYRTDSDFVEERLTGLNLIEFDVKSDGPEGINAPDYMRDVDAFTNWLKTHQKVTHVSSISETVKLIYEAMVDEDERTERIPTSRDQIAQFLLLYELSLPQGLDLKDRISADKSSTRVTAVLRGATSREIIDLDADAQAWLRTNMPEQSWTQGVSINVVFAYSVLKNVQPMVLGTFISLLIISGLIFIALRDLKLGLIGAVTNTLPIAIGFGLWGYLESTVGLVAAAVPAITLGLIVDDTIHFLVKYQRARKMLNLPPVDAAKYAMNIVGKAIVITTVSLMIGFLILTMSGFEFNRSLGLFTSMIIVAALVVDLVMLPTLLMWLDRGKAPQQAAAQTTSL